MITDFRDFCTWAYVVIDDLYHKLAPLYLSSRPGPAVQGCSDSELITLAVVGECRGWDQETVLLSSWQDYTDLFPVLPTRTRFNCRRRNLMQIINLIRQALVAGLDVAADRQCAIDSLPVPVMGFHLVPHSHNDWGAYRATYGKVSSKKQTIYGYKLHLLVTLGGLILDFELAGANADDRYVGLEILERHGDLAVLGDKGYVSRPIAQHLKKHCQVELKTLPKRNQKQGSPHSRLLHNHFRQIVETVNGQLTEQFNVESNHAHSFWGLCSRIYTKLAAHTLSIYLNRLMGNLDFLHIKALAFLSLHYCSL